MVNFLAEDQSLATHKTLSSSETHQNLIELNLFICDSSSRHDNVWLSVSLSVGQSALNELQQIKIYRTEHIAE